MLMPRPRSMTFLRRIALGSAIMHPLTIVHITAAMAATNTADIAAMVMAVTEAMEATIADPFIQFGAEIKTEYNGPLAI